MYNRTEIVLVCQKIDRIWDPIDIRGVSPSHVNRNGILSSDAQGTLSIIREPHENEPKSRGYLKSRVKVSEQ